MFYIATKINNLMTKLVWPEMIIIGLIKITKHLQCVIYLETISNPRRIISAYLLLIFNNNNNI